MPTNELDWLLEKFVTKVPDTQAAVLVSADGLLKAQHGQDEDSAEKLSAIVSGLVSLAEGCRELIASGRVKQVVVELEDALLFCTAAGAGSLLGVLTGMDADAGDVGYQMQQLVRALSEHLITPARAS